MVRESGSFILVPKGAEEERHCRWFDMLVRNITLLFFFFGNEDALVYNNIRLQREH